MKKFNWELFLSGTLLLVLFNFKVFAQSNPLDVQKIGTEILESTHQNAPDADGWKRSSQADSDSVKFKDQSRSQINWERVHPDHWLDVKIWIKEREGHDLEEEWRTRLRSKNNSEVIGKILSCKGQCRVFRGDAPVNGQYLTEIREGDDIETSQDSYAWILNSEGSMFRISPETNLSFSEINLSPKKSFLLMRLNKGMVYWLPRENKTFETEVAPETDAIFLPLMVKEANLEFHTRDLYQQENFFGKINQNISLKQNAYQKMQETLKTLFEENNLFAKDLNHELFLVTPVGTVYSENVAIRAFYKPLQTAFIKGYSIDSSEEKKKSVKIYLRGYDNNLESDLTLNEWFQIDERGRNLGTLDNISQTLLLEDLSTKRIFSILMARELELKNKKEFYSFLSMPNEMAKNYGYTLWMEKLDERVSFLKEYTRRTETTFLTSLEKLKSLSSVDTVDLEQTIDEGYNRMAMHAYYMSFKESNSLASASIKEMTPWQFYGWILKNAKP